MDGETAETIGMTKTQAASDRATAARREQILAQRGGVVWFTGLSGSGKTTLARALEAELLARGHRPFILDGDSLRTGLCRDLGFSEADRNENIRRAAEVARLFADCGVLCLTAFISPMRAAREQARAIVGPDRFLEVHLCTDFQVCEQRDVKGLYKRARAGQVADFTGLTSPYEPPLKPDLAVDTAAVGVEEAVGQLLAALQAKGLVREGRGQGVSGGAGRGTHGVLRQPA